MNQNYYPIEFDGDSFVVINNGTAPAPCVLTVIPKVDFIKIEIKGLSQEAITVKNIKARDVLVIDAEQRQVLVNDLLAFDKYDAWEFPKLQPGKNIITIKDGAQCSISIEYNVCYT